MTIPLKIFHIDMNFVCYHDDYLRAWLQRAADLGYNAVLWELEDKVQWETCPECVWPEAMSKDEFRSLLAYSRELGLEPIPLLQTIGHGEYVMKHETYAHFREQKDRSDCYCTTNPAVKTFLKTWVEEYLDLFGSVNHFHLGGDEAYVFATCEQCTAYANATSPNKLYADHINDIAEPLRKKGIRPGIWCDMVLHYPKDVSEIAKDFVIWDWNYWSNINDTQKVLIWGDAWYNPQGITETHKKDFPELMIDQENVNPYYTIDVLKRLGYDIITCSAARSAGDTAYLSTHDVHVKNIISAALKAEQEHLLGTCVTNWAIRLNILETQILPLASASTAIEHSDLELQALVDLVSSHIAGNATIHQALTLISSFVPFCSTGSTGVQWNTLKDSTQAPQGYLAGVLTSWSDEDPGHKKRINELRTSLQNIEQGLTLLEQHMDSVAEAYKHMLQISQQAGMLQLQHGTLALKILNGEHVAIAEVECLKQGLYEYLSIAEKPQSAAKNAGLIYDTLIEYLSQ